MNRTKKQKEKNVKLANQIGNTICLVLLLVFAVMVTTSVVSSNRAMEDLIESGLLENADNTAKQVKAVFDSAEMVAQDLHSYIQRSYEVGKRGYSNMSEAIIPPNDTRVFTSIIYNTKITEMNADVEKYLIETARASVLSDNGIVGVGIMFEPYSFDVNIESYAIYIDKSVGANGKIKPFGSYEEYSGQDYYRKALEAKKAVFTDPYEFNGQILITCAMPVIIDNFVKGVIMVDIKSDDFANCIKRIEKYPSMFTTIYSSNRTIMFDSQADNTWGHNMDEYFLNQDELDNVHEQLKNNVPFSAETVREDGRAIIRYYTPLPIGDEMWWSMSALYKNEKNKDSLRMLIVLLVTSITSLIIIVFSLIKVIKKKLKPIDTVVSAAEEIAKGNLDVEIQIQSNDEIGKLGVAFQNTIDSLKKIIFDIDYLLGQMADRNFAAETASEEVYVGEYINILTSMKKLNANLSNTLKQIAVASDHVALGSNQMAESAQSLAEGATDQAGAVEELTATIENVAAASIDSAEQSKYAYEQSLEYEKEAEYSNGEMEKLNNAMKKIIQTSKQIEQIISEIEDIASQTNLLSLNASIEAARAGEAGKGFAVVADQIGKLASDSAKSAVNTRELIQKSMEEIKTGSDVTEHTAQSLQKVIDGIKILAAASQKTNDLAHTQAETMKQIQEGVEQISSVVQNNSAAAEETSATSEELSAQAENLKQLVEQFQLQS